MIYLLIWIACAIGAMAIALRKGENGILWACLGFFLGPIGLLIIGILPSKNTPTYFNSKEPENNNSSETREDKALKALIKELEKTKTKD